MSRVCVTITAGQDWSLFRVICDECVTVARDVRTLRYWHGSDSLVTMRCGCGTRVLSISQSVYVNGPTPYKVLTSTHFTLVGVDLLQKYRDTEERDMLESAARLARFDEVLASMKAPG